MPFGGIDVVVEDLAGAGEQFDLFVQPLEASSQGGQELGAGFEVGTRAGDAGLKEPDLLGRQSGFEQVPDLSHGQDVVVAVLAVATGLADGYEQALGLVVPQLMGADSGPLTNSPISTVIPP